MLGWIVFTVVIAGLIGVPFLHWRSVRRRVQAAEAPVLGGIDRASYPYWKNSAYPPDSGAKEQAKTNLARSIGFAYNGNLVGRIPLDPYDQAMGAKHRVLFDGELDPSDPLGR
jgi:hypothetical protein